MTDSTAIYRLPNEGYDTMRKIAYNLIPYPNLNFLLMLQNPLLPKQNEADLYNELLNAKKQFSRNRL